MSSRVVDLADQPKKILEDAAKLLVEEFDPSHGWPALDLAREEVRGREHRRRGIGRKLVEAFESEARSRGALTVTLGTDDTSGMTSLSAVDLYADIPGHIGGLRDHGKHHPFLFYQKLGYVVTGVMPDANGPGKPDIFMSKRVSR